MKNVIIIIVLLITSLSFSQTLPVKTLVNKHIKYSENSKLTVFYSDSLKYKPKNKPAAYFINNVFIEEYVFKGINPDQIKSLNIEKVNYKRNGIDYYGKILIKMKPDYKLKFITLNALVRKHLKLDNNPIVFQINEEVIPQDYNDYLVEEEYILKILVSQVKTSRDYIKINLVKLITKTKENIAKANEIRIRGNEILLQEN